MFVNISNWIEIASGIAGFMLSFILILLPRLFTIISRAKNSIPPNKQRWTSLQRLTIALLAGVFGVFIGSITGFVVGGYLANFQVPAILYGPLIGAMYGGLGGLIGGVAGVIISPLSVR